MLKMCLNWKVLIPVAAGVLLLTVTVPGFTSVLPVLLFLAVCPLMMFLMMRGMMGGTPTGAPPDAPQAEPTAGSNANATAAELRVEQAQLNRRLAALEAGQSPGTLEAPGPRRL